MPSEIPSLPCYPVDLPALKEHFPHAFDVAPLLRNFAKWAAKRTWGSVGCFRIGSQRWNDSLGENFGDLYSRFAVFLCAPDGSEVSYWLSADNKCQGVVYLGSEGERRVLANSLEDFLAKLAQSQTGIEDLDCRTEGVADQRQELLHWLKSQQVEARPSAVNGSKFTNWIDNYQEQQQRIQNHSPLYLELGDRLRCIAPPPRSAEPWWHSSFDVLLVGSHFQVWHREFGPQLLKTKAVTGLEPLFRAHRVSRAQACPERGLWFYSWVTVSPTGGAHLRCDFYREPKILDDVPTVPVKEYRADLQEFPRSSWWMPGWLKERLAARPSAN